MDDIMIAQGTPKERNKKILEQRKETVPGGLFAVICRAGFGVCIPAFY